MLPLPASLLALALAAGALAPGVTGPVAAGLAQEIERIDPVDAAAKRALEEAPPRTRLGNMRGFQAVSRVAFVALPDDPHRLTFSAAFPERTRLSLSSAAGQRQVMRLGSGWFGHDKLIERGLAQKPSYLLEGAGRDETRLDFALRRALFLWPDGASFVGEGLSRTAKIGKVGVLLVNLDRETERPVSIRAFDRTGRAAAEVREITWTRDGDRTWPKTFTFLAGGQPLWKEEVERVRADFLFTDTMFLPGDRVGRLVGESHGSAVRAHFQAGAWTKRVPLPTGTDAEAAADRALELWADLKEDLAERDVEIATDVVIEVDGDRRPVALLMEVSESPAHDAALEDDREWTLRDPSESWAFRCGTLEEASEAAFRAVEEKLSDALERVRAPEIRLTVRPSKTPNERTVLARIDVLQAFRVREPRRGEPGGR
ncbi:MAG: hypothetical protein AAGI22_02795 [Planctomycetota bacterium]